MCVESKAIRWVALVSRRGKLQSTRKNQRGHHRMRRTRGEGADALPPLDPV